MQQAGRHNSGVLQGMLVIPELLAGMTDSAQWAAHYPDTPILRLAPVAMNRTAGDVKRIHGVNERVSIQAYLDAIAFYVHYMRSTL